MYCFAGKISGVYWDPLHVQLFVTQLGFFSGRKVPVFSALSTRGTKQASPRRRYSFSRRRCLNKQTETNGGCIVQKLKSVIPSDEHQNLFSHSARRFWRSFWKWESDLNADSNILSNWIHLYSCSNSLALLSYHLNRIVEKRFGTEPLFYVFYSTNLRPLVCDFIVFYVISSVKMTQEACWVTNNSPSGSV